jgi:hypothetical protein
MINIHAFEADPDANRQQVLILLIQVMQFIPLSAAVAEPKCVLA